MRKTIAIDFDGTCVTHEYPNVGMGVGAVPVLKRLAKTCDLILWTMRSGKELSDAVEWMRWKGIPLVGVNENPTQGDWTDSSKVYANLYIDDAALGAPLIYPPLGRPHVDWDAIADYLADNGYFQVV